jgi:SAM-dependent methyltransferase
MVSSMVELTSASDAMRLAVQRLYDADPANEWARMDRHRTEFAVTLRALNEYLPRPPARVLDCGGGPERYAIELARQGYDVVLFDLSAGNLALAREKAAEAGVALTFVQGTALDLSRFADGEFDAVLCWRNPSGNRRWQRRIACSDPAGRSSRRSLGATRPIEIAPQVIPIVFWANATSTTGSWRMASCRRVMMAVSPSLPISLIRPRLPRFAGHLASRSRPCSASKAW